jgi:apolipoprotein N-acyltransferase
MKYLRPLVRYHYPLAVLSGILLWLSFPGFSWFPLAWIALIPLMISIIGATPLKAGLLGIITGLIAYTGITYWIVPTVYTATGSLIQTILCQAVLSVYLSLFIALWAYLIRAVDIKPSLLRFSLFSAALWIAFEYFRSWLFGGFPWVLLGYSQWKFLSLIQLAEYTGVFGISFLIVVVNTSILRLLTTKRALPFVGLLFVFAAVGVLGKVLYISNTTSSPPYIKVAVLQGNVDQYQKFDAAYQSEIIETYTTIARQAARTKPDIIIWPETSVPGVLPRDPALYSWVSSLSRETGAYNIVGSIYNNGGKDYYNSSILFGTEGEILGWHKKNHLVPFGEYIPFRKYLAPFFKIFNEMGDLTKGTQPDLLPVKSVLISSIICSENFFGSLVRRFVRKGGEVVVSQTNDAWYLNTSAAMQHFVMNVFRAVENRRTVIVAGNTGVSGIIEPNGRVSAQLPEHERAFLAATVSPSKVKTFYTIFGDWFALLCVAYALLILILKFKYLLPQKILRF